jgi:hypothetical protein
MICSVQLLANRDAKTAAEEDSLQIVKIVMIYFWQIAHWGGGGGYQKDKHLPQNPFTGLFFSVYIVN